jgi:hypothetical protein
MTDQPPPVAGKDLRDRAVARLKQKRDFGSWIPGIVASTGADAELAHALHERQALRAEGMLDLLSLPVPRSVDRPGRPLMTDTNRPTPRSRGRGRRDCARPSGRRGTADRPW